MCMSIHLSGRIDATPAQAACSRVIGAMSCPLLLTVGLLVVVVVLLLLLSTCRGC